MKLYVLVHVYDHSDGITSGGIELKAFTSKLEADSEMYRQLDETWGQMNQEAHEAKYSDYFGYAYIKHYSSGQRVYDHEWRIRTM